MNKQTKSKQNLKNWNHIHAACVLQETEDDDDIENRCDPFDIKWETSYTPIGIAFIDIQSLSSNQSVPKSNVPVVDASGKHIGKLSISIGICSSNWVVQNRTRKVPSENLVGDTNISFCISLYYIISK